MPQSPRHLISKGREQECLDTLARLRNASVDDVKVRIEFLEIKALREFEKATAAEKYPQYQDGSFKSNFVIGVKDYVSLVTHRSLFKRTMVATLIMTFQQWNGVRAMPFKFSGVLLLTRVYLDQCHQLLCAFHFRWIRIWWQYDLITGYR